MNWEQLLFDPIELPDGRVLRNREADFPHDFRTRHVAEQFFFGYVEYKDIFGRPHTSQFCMRVYPEFENGKMGKLQFAGSDSWRECT